MNLLPVIFAREIHPAMKKNFFSFLFLLGIGLAACKSGDKKSADHSGHTHSGDAPVTLTDSLLKAIDEGHIAGMSRIGKLHNTQKEVQRVIDSLSQLPPAARQNAEAWLAGLTAVSKDLQYADFAMDKWMMEYDEDSAKDDADRRLEYLKEEKDKVEKMKSAIIGSMQKADSLLKQRP